MSKAVFSVAWFRREDWGAVQETNEGMQNSFDDWLADAESGVAAFERENGATVHKVIITAAKLGERHRALGRKLNSNDRSQLAIQMAASETQGRA